jgi:hypothetical protein
MSSNLDDVIIHQDTPATKNKWFADIHLSSISKDFKDVTVKLQEFTIPRVEVGAASIKFRGTPIDVPNKTFNPHNKVIRFQYLIDSKWENYLALYQWSSANTIIDDPTPNDKIVQNSKKTVWWAIPIHVYLVDEFHKPSIHIVYYGCTLKELSELNVSYTSEPDVVPHSFTVAYQRLDISHRNPLDRANGIKL